MVDGMHRCSARHFVSLVLLCLLLSAYSVAADPQHKWNIEVVDGGREDMGRQSSLAIDRFGAMHVSYFNATNPSLRYAYKNGKQWFRMAIEGRGAGNYSSVAVDSAGRPVVAYSSIREDGLHFAQFDGTKWTGMIVDPIHTQFYVSTQVDKKGFPHISYYYTVKPDGQYALNTKYAYFDGTQWYIQTVDSRYGTGKFNSLAIDADGLPHITYTNIHTGDLDYATWDRTDWTFEVADARSVHNSYVAWGNSIALDSKGMPHVAHFDGTKNAVRYSSRDETGWKNEVIASLSGYIGSDLDHVSLKLDSHDLAHVAFFDAGNGTLYFASRSTDGQWTLEAVDQGGAGMYPSLALDAHDVPSISYYDPKRRSLKVATLIATPDAGPGKSQAGNPKDTSVSKQSDSRARTVEPKVGKKN